MKAMIFAAGLGTRLKPLTNNLPKALIPYKNKPLLQHIIEKLSDSGINEIVVNTHHFSDLVKKFLEQNNNFGKKIYISDESDLLMDTGGGLYNARKFLNDSDFIVHNVDIFSDLDIKKLIAEHEKNSVLATLAVQNRQSDKKLYFNIQEKTLCYWRNEQSGQIKLGKNCPEAIGFAYSGIFVASPRIFEFMESGVYSVIDTFLKAAQTENLTYYDHSGSFWRDMGKVESFEN